MTVTGLVADRGIDHMWGMGTGWWWILMVVFWVVIIGVIVWAVRSLPGRDRSSPPGGRDRAREILDERYARGEISTEEYRERRDAMR